MTQTPITRALLFLLLAACSSAPATTSDAGDAGAPTQEAGADGSPRSNACQTQDQKLQAALDVVRKSPNALLAVRNPECGTSVYVSGDASGATIDSLWRIGSCTKTYVSASILSLVKEGKVSLDDPLSKWVTNVPNTTGVTVTMLLDHRSGIFNYTEDAQFAAKRTTPTTPRQIVDLAAAHAPYFAPDAGFHYSNTNYVLLGMILEAATGMKAGPVLHARALGPAKLAATLLDGEDTVDKGRMARGFSSSNKDVTFLDDMSWPWTAGSMVASGADLADWVATLYDSTAVLDPSQRALLASKTSDFGSGTKYGLGVVLLDPAITGGAGAGLGHGGAIDGFYTQAFYFPDKKTAIVSITNQDGTNPNDITAAALKSLF